MSWLLKKVFCLLRQLIVLSLLFYSYFVFVYIFCIKSLQTKTIQDSKLNVNLIFGYLFVFNLNFMLVIWFYLLIICKRHAKAQERFHLDTKFLKKLNLDICDVNDDFENFEIKLNLSQNSQLEVFAEKRKICLKTRNNYGQIRICLKCCIIKPDRCSHCKSCQKCILKRDHNCPWLNKCIGYSNQKYYICMLTYLTSMFSFILTSLFCTVFDKLKLVHSNFNKDSSLFFNLSIEERANMIYIFILYLLCVLFICPICLLLINTYCLAFANLTNIEQNFPPFITDINESDRRATMWENFKEIFGSSYLLAYLPLWTTPGDGENFSFNLRQVDKGKFNCFCV